MDPAALAAWYSTAARDLPWRRTRDPWAILLSEVLLQQTQVARGLEYWSRLLVRFPTPAAMAEADLEEVMHLWQGAGYYARGRRLHDLARAVCDPEAPWGGLLPSPDTAEDVVSALQSLPGIGPYTAAAVASIAHDVPAAVVDGNVRRVVARQRASASPTDAEVQRAAARWMEAAVEAGVSPSVWNQAVMDLGATVCRPRGVRCSACPVKTTCKSTLTEEGPESFPSPKPRRVTTEHLVAVVDIDEHGRPHLVQRPATGRFAGLWGPPMHDANSEEAMVAKASRTTAGHVTHLLSHRRLEVEVLLGKAALGRAPDAHPTSSLDDRVLALAMDHADL